MGRPPGRRARVGGEGVEGGSPSAGFSDLELGEGHRGESGVCVCGGYYGAEDGEKAWRYYSKIILKTKFGNTHWHREAQRG